MMRCKNTLVAKWTRSPFNGCEAAVSASRGSSVRAGENSLLQSGETLGLRSGRGYGAATLKSVILLDSKVWRCELAGCLYSFSGADADWEIWRVVGFADGGGHGCGRSKSRDRTR